MRNPKTAALLSLVYCLSVIGSLNKLCGKQGLKAVYEASDNSDGGNDGDKNGTGKEGDGKSQPESRKIKKC